MIEQSNTISTSVCYKHIYKYLVSDHFIKPNNDSFGVGQVKFGCFDVLFQRGSIPF